MNLLMDTEGSLADNEKVTQSKNAEINSSLICKVYELNGLKAGSS